MSGAVVGYESVGRTSQKQRTRKALKDAASELIAAGKQPTVAEVAESARISKSTAYRYFPSQELMYAELALAAAVGADRQRVHEAARGRGDASERLERVMRADHAFTKHHEEDLRAGLRAFLLLIERHPDVPRGPSSRAEILTTALAPVADELPAGAMRRLVAALSLCMGVEAALITEVSCGLSTQEGEEVKRWAAAALLKAALAEAGSRPPS